MLDSCTWLPSQLNQALLVLAQQSKYLGQQSSEATPFTDQADEQALTEWFHSAAQHLGVDIESVETTYPQLTTTLTKIAPAIIGIKNKTSNQFLLILKSNHRYATVITPDQQQQQIPIDEIKQALVTDMETPVIPMVEQLLLTTKIADNRRQAISQAILSEQLKDTKINGIWLMRLAPGDQFWKHVQHAGIMRQLMVIISATFIVQMLFLLSWWIIGKQAFQGYFDQGWVIAWGLLLITIIPFQIGGMWLENRLSIKLGGLFRQRLLHGILQLKPEEIRHQGTGQFLSIVMEAESIESLALMGAFTTLLASIEISLSIGVLLLGAGGWFHALLLIIWIAIIGKLCFRHYKLKMRWVTHYRTISNDLAERMVGHRTRLVQSQHADEHDQEDQLLKQYYQYSKQLDNSGLLLQGIPYRGWLIIGMLGLIPALLVAQQPALLAISLGGILLASRSLDRFVDGISSLIGILVAWQQIKPLFQAAKRSLTANKQDNMIKNYTPLSLEQPIITAKALQFRYQAHLPAIIQDCDLQIQQGNRLVLEGASGTGKSTFVSLLANLHLATDGTIQLYDCPQNKINTFIWRQHVVLTPQFHENHVLTETFLFNCLMGRAWPPSNDDIRAAEAICKELQLEQVLAKMPAGIHQMIGESGWRLSHGERSRLYIARTLLQNADLTILDESFASLDPETFQIVFNCVTKHTNALLVIAHP